MTKKDDMIILNVKIRTWIASMFFLSCFLFFSAKTSLAQIAGEHIVGKKQKEPFNSLTNAFQAMQSQGVKGSVCLLLEDVHYETESLEFSSILGMNSSGSLTIKPAQGVKTTLEMTSGTDLFTFSSLGLITICGSYDEQDTVRNLTLKADYPIMINPVERTSSNECLVFTLKNCVLEGYLGVSMYDVRRKGIGVDSVSCFNNVFKTSLMGMEVDIAKIDIHSCSFINCSNYAIRLLNTTESKGYYKIWNNYILNSKNPIEIQSTHINADIYNNKIYSMNIYSYTGIWLHQVSNSNVINNIFVGNIREGTSVDRSADLLLAYNTFFLNPEETNDAYPVCVSFNSLQKVGSIRVENNIFHMECLQRKNGLKTFLMRDISLSTYTPSDFPEFGNCYFTTKESGYWGFCLQSPFATYSDWVKFAHKTHPLSVDLQNSFVSSTDLHLTVPNHQGIPIPEITTDIDGNPRDPLHPDAGAYEFKGNTEVQPDFTSQNTCQPTAFTFTNASSFTSPIWDFGDGKTSSLASPSHSYTATGTYTVSLTATNSSGLTQKVSKTISVYARPTAPVIKISGGR